MDYNTLYTKLNIRLDDTDNFAFTQEEKESILTEAIEDGYVVKRVWDETLTYTTGTWQYAVPSGLTTVDTIYIKPGTNEDPEPISIPFDVIEGNIQFNKNSQQIPSGYTLYIKGKYKYTVDDTITETRVQQYILNLAQLNALDQIGIKKVLKFVKNDISLSEIVALKRELERKVIAHRASIQKDFQSA